ncbi:chromosomal replication initiator protein DnaA [Desulfonema ishimotonii]|uniref:Chromosomal replication initiator protein DnaA n=1 Tax=Desulfonema ishimotonii TaxID=45657 RepID=A0A401FQ23_9BACT|nr:chromosomal replication initiator protein DnaA [Desulfonema ishimotonii]GBC59071.1 chromosomal replication initiator protein DnaA [Desulfonema ishimotonii]
MEYIWKKIKAVIKARIPGHSYRMWIEPIGFVRDDDDAIVLSCPNFFSKKRIQDHYLSMIESEARNISGKACPFVLEIAGKEKTRQKKRTADKNFKPSRQMDLPHAGDDRPRARMMRKEFTFDRFVVGNNNDFAYSAALSLASQSDRNQSSLYLMSETGMGKSHLSQAIGHHILNHHPRDNVYYITAEDFTNEMVQAFRNDNIGKFKEKYRRQCDVLLLEDVHFLTGKERTQAELALALDYLLNADKKIIFTSCYLPTEIPRLNDRLKSRLSSGLISNIEPPDFKTRLKILERKLRLQKLKMPKPVVEYLAGELSENVRQLESGLVGVMAKASLMGTPLDLSLAESVVRNIVRTSRKVTVDLIKETVCQHYKISTGDIVSKSRRKCIVRPRQMAIYLARKYTDQPLQVISRNFNRYHTTAIHSIAAVEKGLTSDVAMKKQLSFLCGKIETFQAPST